MTTALVEQKFEYDCVLACLAMATGKDYNSLWSQDFCEEVEKAKGTSKGTLHERAFLLAGFVSGEDYISVYCEPIQASVIRKLLWGRRALIQVPSINFEKASHFVYWDGKDLFDPK